MIHKIERLRAIGKFHDYTASGDVAFKKMTLIYGDNGLGKTTLTNVIRSLSNGDVALVTRRLTTGSTSIQNATVIQRNIGPDVHHTFRATGWSNPFPDIEIFDSHFVNDNIFSGFQFTDDHNKQLYQFVIGAQGVALQRLIEQNKQQKTASRQLISGYETTLLQHVGLGLTVDQLPNFLTLNVYPNILQAINDGRTTLNRARANNVIQNLRPLQVIPEINTGLNYDEIVTDLEMDSGAIQNEVLDDLFNNHCNELSQHNIGAPQAWLRTGFNYVLGKTPLLQVNEHLNCPFCTQAAPQALDIFTAYTHKFNTAFELLVQHIGQHLHFTRDINIDLIFQGITHIVATNNAVIQDWSTHVPHGTHAPIAGNLANQATLQANMGAVLRILGNKQQNPSLQISGQPVQDLRNEIARINALIRTYNAEISVYNTVTVQLKSSTKTEHVATAELNLLLRRERRFEANTVALINQLQGEKANLRALETAYPPLLAQQEAAATAFFGRYSTRINYYLRTLFKTPFQIVNVSHIPPQGRSTQSRIGYTLEINGLPISFNPQDVHNAKDCLSDGDKSTLALAFFLAKLDVDPNQNNKIVVFDDPLSSFDRNRRMYTVKLLLDRLNLTKQVVVLSHHEVFLHEIARSVPASEKKTLRITEDFVTKASSIENLDLDALVELQYFKHLNELQSFLANLDITKKEYHLGLIRSVLESCLRFRFYRQILPASKTLGSVIIDIERSTIQFRDPDKASIIGSLRLINGVASLPHHGEPQPDYIANGTDPFNMTVTELAQFIVDTLDLIDNKI